MRRFRRVSSTQKDDGSPVTEADRAAEAIIVAGLQEAFPDDGLRGEEGAQRPGDGRCWYIDPIDGTTNFVHDFPFYSVR